VTSEFEDPRKTELRQRCADAVDAAGYTVDQSRSAIAYPPASGLKGSIKPDVSCVNGSGRRIVYFVRVDGEKALPQWLTNIVTASFAMNDLSVYVVTEAIGDALRSTCEAVGCGLLRLSASNELDLELEYTEPDRTKAAKGYARRVRQVRRKLDTKLNANLTALQDQFSERHQVTEGMDEATRAGYLSSIETMMVRWREWGDDLSGRLDGLAGTTDEDALAEIEEHVEKGVDTE
jgi:hypothetical protein